jgi:hypothetical protein
VILVSSRWTTSLAVTIFTTSCLAPADAPSTKATMLVRVEPGRATIVPGDSIHVQVKVWNGADYHDPLGDVSWHLSDTTVAQIESSGAVVGKLVGVTIVTAVTEQLTGQALVTVAPAVLVGAGDIADCSSPNDEATAALLSAFGGTVFTAGDNAYPVGGADDFARCYEPSWGRYKDQTRPAPGNHDYLTPRAAGYFAYFGEAAGVTTQGYYSYDLASWHIVVVNSSADASVGSAQEQWLRADLAAHPARCTLAYWHHPRFSSGPHGDFLQMDAVWEALYEAGAEVVISGHDHDYERFAPQGPSGSPDSAHGIREFVVGTGGASLGAFYRVRPNSEVRNSTTFGVLLLRLYDDRYEWEFVPAQPGGFSDSGWDTCH